VLAGPEEYTYREIVEFVSDLTGNNTNMVDVPTPIIQGIAALWENSIQPVLTQDLVKRMQEDNVFIPYDNVRTFADLGITPGSMEEHAFDYMHRFRQGGHFKMVEGYYATDSERLQRDSHAT
jgi:NADH dehydrogenase (ubiquinone) 1 alpha subcomplex subunit 9